MPTAPHTRIRIVQSRNNGRVKQLRATLLRPGPGLIGLEGLHLVEEALRSDLEVQAIFVGKGAETLIGELVSLLAGTAGARALARVPEILSLPDEVLRSAVTTETPQAIAALAVPPLFALEDLLRGPDHAPSPVEGRAPATTLPPQQSQILRPAPLLLVLAGLQDPGNVGTILRSAEAFGATGVFALPGTASVWNAKSLRASMGSAFRLPVVGATRDQAFAVLAQHGVQSLATVTPERAGVRTLGESDLSRGVALWIGNEGAGLTPALIDRCDHSITIPCPGPVESLNAAVAASVLLYEAARQRSAAAVVSQGPQKEHPIPA